MKTFLDSDTNFPRNASENAMQSWSTSAYLARSMIENSFNMRDEFSANSIQRRGKVALHYCRPPVVYA